MTIYAYDPEKGHIAYYWDDEGQVSKLITYRFHYNSATNIWWAWKDVSESDLAVNYWKD